MIYILYVTEKQNNWSFEEDFFQVKQYVFCSSNNPLPSPMLLHIQTYVYSTTQQTYICMYNQSYVGSYVHTVYFKAYDFFLYILFPFHFLQFFLSHLSRVLSTSLQPASFLLSQLFCHIIFSLFLSFAPLQFLFHLIPASQRFLSTHV